MSLFETVQGHVEDRRESFLQAQSDICRTRLRFGEFKARGVAQPGPAARAAAIRTQKQLVF